MSLAACNENLPLATVLSFAVDDDLTFYFVTRENSHKSLAIQKNSRVSFSVWQYQQMLVQVDGEATRIFDQDEAANAMEKIAQAVESIKNFWPPIISYGTDQQYAVFKIKPLWVRALSLSEHVIKSHEPAFTQIVL